MMTMTMTLTMRVTMTTTMARSRHRLVTKCTSDAAHLNEPVRSAIQHRLTKAHCLINRFSVDWMCCQFWARVVICSGSLPFCVAKSAYKMRIRLMCERATVILVTHAHTHRQELLCVQGSDGGGMARIQGPPRLPASCVKTSDVLSMV